MIVTCDAERWEYVGSLIKDHDEPCGKTFDDAECSTICPHDPLPPKLSEKELQELFDKVNNTEEENK